MEEGRRKKEDGRGVRGGGKKTEEETKEREEVE
jgi:hypothetical protein